MKRLKPPPAALRRIDRAISRMEMATALELHGEGDRDCLHLATLLRSQEPDTLRCSPHTLAQRIGLPYSKIVSTFKEMKRAEAIIQVAIKLPQVAKGIAEDAEVKHLTCGACEGLGRIVIAYDEQKLPLDTKLCIPCEGSGRIRVPGDPQARKQVLEMMGLAGALATPILAPGSQFLFTGESLESTLKAARGGSNGVYRDAGRPETDQRPAGTDSPGTGTLLDGNDQHQHGTLLGTGHRP